MKTFLLFAVGLCLSLGSAPAAPPPPVFDGMTELTEFSQAAPAANSVHFVIPSHPSGSAVALPDLLVWRNPIAIGGMALAVVSVLATLFGKLRYRLGYLAALCARRCGDALRAWRLALPRTPRMQWAGALLLAGVIALVAFGPAIGGTGTLLGLCLLGSVYQIPAIADDDLDLSVSAAVGAETRVFLSYDDVKNAADLEQTAAGTGAANSDDASLVHDGSTLKLDRTFRAPSTTTEGRDLQLVCASPVRSDEAVEVTLNVTLNNVAAVAITSNTIATPTVVTATAHGLNSGDTITIPTNNGSAPTIAGTHVITKLSANTFSIPVNCTTGGTGGTFSSTIRNGTATATLTPPETAQDQSFNFPQGLAVDFTPSGTGNTVRTVVSVEEITGGGPGNKFSIVALPDADSYTEVACATDKSFEPPSPKSISIPCRYNPARWVKKGRGKEQKLDLTAQYSSFGDGLPRANGQRVTAKLETYKNDSILTERVVFGGWRAEVSVSHGDGDNPSTAKCTGMYETMAVFV